MKLDEFREALRSVIGPDIEDMWVERFFSEVRRNKDVFVKVVIKKEKHTNYTLYTSYHAMKFILRCLLDDYVRPLFLLTVSYSGRHQLYRAGDLAAVVFLPASGVH